ncbi:MAG TPA: hypothetical protein VFM80_12015 [Gracilimonas sp.]|uniref:hypothetical protein n=1 Tax=Gracilimonas sp. TaxID=1974203 RepID=UPI002DACF905|nr:hypothetical protein [Gracilimonas sp.]
MGQQQLLILVLVTIIAGIATIIALNVLAGSAERANIDAVRKDMLTIASASQSWYVKPAAMGGGDDSYTGMTFKTFSFPTEGVNEDADIAWNANGTYQINTAASSSFIITGHPATCNGYVEGTGGCEEADQLTAEVTPNNIDWDTEN